MPTEIPSQVLDAYGWSDLEWAPLGTGLINATFQVLEAGHPIAVLQRLHPVFAGEVNIDLDAVTAHLAGKGIETPRLIRTRAGDRWIEVEGRPWRAITFIAGRCVDRVTELDQARSAGALVGRVHCALGDLDYAYAHVRAGVHDTERHVRTLRELHAVSKDDEANALAAEILATAERLPRWDQLPRRHSHGDLKLSNVLFAPDRWEARCLIDLDTFGLQTIAYELGDALRSWCNPSGEDVAEPALNLDILEAAVRGYGEGARGLLGRNEIEAIVPGLETICVELAARFAADVYQDCYFGWDPARFPSRRAHNLIRARGQLALARSVGEQRADANERVRAALT